MRLSVTQGGGGVGGGMYVYLGHAHAWPVPATLLYFHVINHSQNFETWTAARGVFLYKSKKNARLARGYTTPTQDLIIIILSHYILSL
jgi:hypothetical protein